MPELVPVQMQVDAEIRRVMEWRNDPGARACFFHPEPKKWPDYRLEFTGHYAKAALAPQFICDETGPHGFLGFRNYGETGTSAWGGRSVSVDILIAPEARGRGLGAWALEQVPMLAQKAGVTAAVGEVKTTNVPSIRIFEKSPFTRFDAIDKTVPDTGQTHAIIRYVWKRA